MDRHATPSRAAAAPAARARRGERAQHAERRARRRGVEARGRLVGEQEPEARARASSAPIARALALAARDAARAARADARRRDAREPELAQQHVDARGARARAAVAGVAHSSPANASASFTLRNGSSVSLCGTSPTARVDAASARAPSGAAPRRPRAGSRPAARRAATTCRRPTDESRDELAGIDHARHVAQHAERRGAARPPQLERHALEREREPVRGHLLRSRAAFVSELGS